MGGTSTFLEEEASVEETGTTYRQGLTIGQGISSFLGMSLTWPLLIETQFILDSGSRSSSMELY